MWAKIHSILVLHSLAQEDPANLVLHPPERVRLYDRETEKTPELQVGRRCFAARGVKAIWRLAVGDQVPAGQATSFLCIRQQRYPGYDLICSVMKYWMCLNKQVMKRIFINLVESLRVQRAHDPTLSKISHTHTHKHNVTGVLWTRNKHLLC